MKRYIRHMTVDELRTACAAKGIVLDTNKYDVEGSDYVTLDFTFDGERYRTLYNTFNGRFFGRSDGGINFSSDKEEHDAEAWFQALMDFVYVPASQDETMEDRGGCYAIGEG